MSDFVDTFWIHVNKIKYYHYYFLFIILLFIENCSGIPENTGNHKKTNKSFQNKYYFKKKDTDLSKINLNTNDIKKKDENINNSIPNIVENKLKKYIKKNSGVESKVKTIVLRKYKYNDVFNINGQKIIPCQELALINTDNIVIKLDSTQISSDSTELIIKLKNARNSTNIIEKIRLKAIGIDNNKILVFGVNAKSKLKDIIYFNDTSKKEALLHKNHKKKLVLEITLLINNELIFKSYAHLNSVL